MKLLSVSTAEQGCSLAIMDKDHLICEEYWASKRTHSRRLLDMIEHLIEKRAGLTLADIDGFVAARGPGSFTGLRIGISVVQGMAYAMEKPCAGVSSLDGIGFRFMHSALPVCAMMDARRNEVYCAVYEFDRGHLVSKSDERVLAPEAAIEMIDGPAVFAGSGSKAYAGIIEKKAVSPLMSPEMFDSVNAAALVFSFYRGTGGFSREENILTPVYIRKSDAEIQSS